MALNKGIWDPKTRATNNKGTNLKSLMLKDWRLNGGSRFAKKDCLGLIVPGV